MLEDGVGDTVRAEFRPEPRRALQAGLGGYDAIA